MKTSFESLSYEFALSIVSVYKELSSKKAYTLSSQILRSGTAIRALYSEAKYAQSKADFISKLSIARKECNECLYWIELLHDSGLLNENQFHKLHTTCTSLLKILTAMIKTSIVNSAKNSRVSNPLSPLHST